MSRVSGYMRYLSFGVPFKAFTRDIWIICLSNIIGAFGEGLYFWVFPLYIRSLQADYVQLGIVFSALYGASALAPLPGGWFADRFDRKKVMIMAWAPWGIAPLIYSFAQNWTQLIPGTIFWGISMIGVPAVTAYVVTAVKDERSYASVLAFVWSSYSFSYIFAPTVGAFLATAIGMQWVLRISAALCGVATAVFFFLSSQHPKRSGEVQVVSFSPVEESRRWRKMIVWSIFFTAIMFFMTVGRPFVQTFLSEQVKLSEFYVGLFGSINFAGMTFLGLGIGRLGDKWSKTKAMSLCLLFYIVSMIPLLFIHETVSLMVAGVFFGGAVVTNSIVSSYVGIIAPLNKRGLWMSIPQTLSLLAAFAAPYLGGYLYTLSPYYALLVSVGAMPILIVYALVWLRE